MTHSNSHRTQQAQGAQQALGSWVRHTSRGLPPEALPSRRARLGDHVHDTLLALRDDRTPLPPALRQLLGPLRPRTYDAAARLLLWARHAPQGPRCRSYRAALYLVQRLDGHDLDGHDLDTSDLRQASA